MKKLTLFPLFAILTTCTLNAQTISFAPKEILFAHPEGNTFNSLEFDSPYLPCDYNNDGYVDFVGKRSSQEQLILKGTAVDTFQEVNILPVGSPSAGVVFDVLDFDQDGDEDIIAERYILINEGDDLFSFLNVGLSIGFGFEEFVIGVADFNGDDLLDLLVLKDVFFEDEEMAILTNNGDGTFTKCLIFLGDRIGDTEIGDIDNDGDLDIVTSSSNNNGTILLLKNDGDCQFSNSEMIYEGFTPLSNRSIEVNDMNGDDQLDILVIGFSSVFIFENTDGFVTEPPFTSISTGQNTFFNVADFNNDGKADIAVLTRESSFKIAVFENLGNMSFSSTIQAASFSLAPGYGTPDYNYFEQNMSLYDYDDNGMLDIIFTNGFGPLGSNNVSLVLNTTEVVSVDDIFANAIDLAIFPNPATAEISLPLLFDANDNKATFFQLTNINGQTVKSGYLNSTTIDINDIANGQYILLLSTDSGDVYHSTFIKM
jgi:hypothetical protein